MKCEKIQEYLPLYVGRELTWWKKLIVHNHLIKCKNCHLEYNKLNKVKNLTKKSIAVQPVPNIDTQFLEKIILNLKKQKEQKRHHRKTFKDPRIIIKRTVPALVGLVLLLLVLILGDDYYLKKYHKIKSIDESISYPVVEAVHKPNVTVMTFKTDNPKITIVWFFEEES
jgi:predicted anti-sigma-YlaC factor YlaD